MLRKLTPEMRWLFLIVTTFFIVNCFSLHTGDDLGYMFADTTHHCGDGVRVTSLSQCFSTQCHHYLTTNGRFMVHVVVMAMLNLVPLWVYRVLNALMFGMLWLLTCRLVDADKRTNTLYAVAWLLLFVALPQPGLVLLTLVSYSVNYLWVGVAALALLLALKRKPKNPWLLVYAFFVGSLQESFSLPLCAGLFVGALMKRVPWPVTCAFIMGTLAEVLAPGNMAHAAQGGGFTLNAISAKIAALGSDLCMSIITPALVAAVIWLIARPRKSVAFFKENIVLTIAIVAALGLATLTFTSPRQLTAPSLFTIVLLLKLLPSKKWLTVGSSVLVVAVLAVMGVYKYKIYNRYQTFVESVSRNDVCAYPQGEAPYEGNAPFARAFIPDPLCNRGLVAVGDKYTKNGLQRLRNGGKLNTILPQSPLLIAQQMIGKCDAEVTDSTYVAHSVRIGSFDVIAVPTEILSTHKDMLPKVSYERFKIEDATFFVLTTSTPTVTFKKKIW